MGSHPSPLRRGTPRILFLADAGSPIIQQWLSHCVRQGYATSIVTLNTTAAVPEGVDSFRPSRPVRGTIADYLRFAPSARSWARGKSADIVHAHYGGGYGMLGALMGSPRFVLSLWGTDLLVAPEQSRARRAALGFMMRSAAAVCVNSAHLQRKASSLTTKPVQLTYFGVDPLFFAAHSGERPAGAPLRIVIVKSFNPNSGIDTLLAAIAILKDEGIDVSLSAVGLSDGTPERLAHELGIDSLVRFLGPLDKKPLRDLFVESDVYVQPTSFTEGFGVAVAEAQASGLPAVVSDVGGLVESRSADAGQLVPPRDPQALAAALARYATDQALLTAHRAVARAHAEQFRWDVVAPAMDVVYEKVMSGILQRHTRRPPGLLP